MKSKYTDEQLIEAIATSISYRGALIKLGIQPEGGNYRQIQKRILRVGCDISHFLGQRHGTSVQPKKMLICEMLTENSFASSQDIKRRLLSEKIFEYRCSCCHLTEWLSKPISLHLDHINGVNTDCRLENLRLLCPNCHSQTETYCRGTRRKAQHQCLDCNRLIEVRFVRCNTCAATARLSNLHAPLPKIDWPSIEKLQQDLQSNSFVAVAAQLGVSDNAVRDHLRKHGVEVRKRK
jgi:Zn finger protein HypA/HybF involved in hydrogenase expression